MGYMVVGPCLATYQDGVQYAAPLSPGWQVVTCSSSSAFVDLTAEQKQERFLEGHELGWGVASAMIFAWSILIIKKALQ